MAALEDLVDIFKGRATTGASKPGLLTPRRHPGQSLTNLVAFKARSNTISRNDGWSAANNIKSTLYCVSCCIRTSTKIRNAIHALSALIHYLHIHLVLVVYLSPTILRYVSKVWVELVGIFMVNGVDV